MKGYVDSFSAEILARSRSGICTVGDMNMYRLSTWLWGVSIHICQNNLGIGILHHIRIHILYNTYVTMKLLNDIINQI